MHGCRANGIVGKVAGLYLNTLAWVQHPTTHVWSIDHAATAHSEDVTSHRSVEDCCCCWLLLTSSAHRHRSQLSLSLGPSQVRRLCACGALRALAGIGVLHLAAFGSCKKLGLSTFSSPGALSRAAAARTAPHSQPASNGFRCAVLRGADRGRPGRCAVAPQST